MPEVVRNLKKQGAKNRTINASIKEMMETIKEKRKKVEEERKAKFLRIKEEKDAINNDSTPEEITQT